MGIFDKGVKKTKAGLFDKLSRAIVGKSTVGDDLLDAIEDALIATDMGNLEAKEGGMLIPFAAEERMGKPEELGYALATVADERNGYLAGVDILCDGGSTNGMKEFKKKKK